MIRACAPINVAAIERNVQLLRGRLQVGTSLCAVVKADGYGHGAVPSAQAAISAGATWLAVATASEAIELRAAGLASRILVLGALSSAELRQALAARADVVAWTDGFVGELASAASLANLPARVRVHVKLDSGMGRLGTRDCDTALEIAERVAANPRLELTGAMTHLATADGDQSFVRMQLDRFVPLAAKLRRTYPGITIHAANSAATIREPASHFDLVRCGIALYGCDPMNEDPATHGLEPALELTSYLAAIKRAQPGDSVGYGRRFIAEQETFIGTVPIGYADGIRRAFTNKCDLLIGGRRYPLVGAVSMDNVSIDLGPNPEVAVGARATIIGVDGSERQTAEQLARQIDTINYEIVAGLSNRVPRIVHRD